MLRIYQSRPSHANLLAYKRQRADTRRVLKSTRRESWRTFISTLSPSTGMRSVWNTIRSIKGRSSGIQTPTHLHVNDTLITDIPHIADTLASTISDNSSDARCRPSFLRIKSIAEAIDLDFSSDNTESYNHLFTLDELHISLSKAHNTSPGPDDIPYDFLRHLPLSAKHLLLSIFNYIWTTGDIPSLWKEAFVIPIPKPGKDHSIPTNYRPISLTSCICKTFERMINDRLVWVLESRNLLSNIQCGFRKGRSTIDHLLRLDTYIKTAFSKRQRVVVVFFDLEKAYDTTWRYGILRDLHCMGFRGRLPLFLSAFLTARSFRVRIGSTLSHPFPQDIGVPQGSVLSVTLFSIKINSIAGVLQSDTMGFLFVDDFALGYAHRDMDIINAHLQTCLGRLEHWADHNGFRFSVSKTVCMHFSRLVTAVRSPTLTLYGTLIPLVKEFRFLGLLLDPKLKYDRHIYELRLKCKLALNIIFVLANTSWGCDRTLLLTVYRSLVRSKLDYACQVYGSASNYFLRSLDTIHHRGIRVALGAFPTTPIQSLYAAANEPSLRARRTSLSLNYMLRLLQSPSNPAYDCVFDPCYESAFDRPTRSKPALGIREGPSFSACDIPADSILPLPLSPTPPWFLPSIPVHLHLHEYSKLTTSSLVYLTLFREYVSLNPTALHIFTDGSKDESRVAAAACTRSTYFASRLPAGASIYTAELYGLIFALRIIRKARVASATIFSDSLSALTAIQCFQLTHPLVLQVFLEHSKLSSHVSFCWLPGHAGIPGNERADKLAKAALSSSPLVKLRIPGADYKPSIRQFIRHFHQVDWSSTNSIRATLYFTIYPTLGAPRALSLPRHDDVVMTRVLFGHTRYTHGHLLRGVRGTLVCPHCTTGMGLTIPHILLYCPGLQAARSQYYGCSDIVTLLRHVPAPLILGFLRHVRLYSLM